MASRSVRKRRAALPKATKSAPSKAPPKASKSLVAKKQKHKPRSMWNDSSSEDHESESEADDLEDDDGAVMNQKNIRKRRRDDDEDDGNLSDHPINARRINVAAASSKTAKKSKSVEL